MPDNNNRVASARCMGQFCQSSGPPSVYKLSTWTTVRERRAKNAKIEPIIYQQSAYLQGETLRVLLTLQLEGLDRLVPNVHGNS